MSGLMYYVFLWKKRPVSKNVMSPLVFPKLTNCKRKGAESTFLSNLLIIKENNIYLLSILKDVVSLYKESGPSL